MSTKYTKKRWASMLLVMVMLAGMLLTTGFAEPPQENGAQTFAVGQKLQGFTVKKVAYWEGSEDMTYLFEHDKTGAQVIYLQNDDTDLGFSIGFKTPANDDRGANHVLEHVLLTGSTKYPSKDIYYDARNNTLNSLMNGYTYQGMTMYPVASPSEAQLMKLTDLYMSCVFEPFFYQEPRILEREAWHYELESVDAPLTVTGIVYNEMQANVSNISRQAFYNLRSALFRPDGDGNNSGGLPENILSLTPADIVRVYEKYYVASNSLAVLYGNLDCEAFLKLLNDSYFSHMERKTVTNPRKMQEPFAQMRVANFLHPVASNAQVQNQSVVALGYAMGRLSDGEINDLNIMTGLLSHSGAPLMQALYDSGLASNYSISFDHEGTQPMIEFDAFGTDADAGADIAALITDQLKQIVAEGFDPMLVDAVLSSAQAQALLSMQNSSADRPDKALQQVSLSWVKGNDLSHQRNAANYIKELHQRITPGYFERLIQKYILDNPFAALTTTTPRAGLLEQNQQRQQERLAKIKAGMSQQQLDELVAKTQDLAQWSTQKTDPKIIADLQAVTVDELPVHIPSFDITDTTNQGIRYLQAEVELGGISQTGVLVDTSAVPLSLVHYLRLYQAAIGSLDTQQYTSEQLSLELTRSLADISIKLVPRKTKGEQGYFPAIEINWTALNEQNDNAVGLVKSLLLDSRLDADTLAWIIQAEKDAFLSVLDDPMSTFMSRRIKAITDGGYRYWDYFEGLPYYRFLLEVEDQLTAEPEVVFSRIEQARSLAFNQNNLTVFFVGDEQANKAMPKAVSVLIDALDKTKQPAQSYADLPVPARREGIAWNTSVQFSVLHSTKPAALQEDAQVLGNFLSDQMLLPELRFKNGAYGGGASLEKDSMILYSYRDPDFTKSLQVFKQVPSFVKQMELTQSVVDSNILSTYGRYAVEPGKIDAAFEQLNALYLGESIEDLVQKRADAIKGATVQGLKGYADTLQQMLDQAAYSVVASPGVLESNKHLFDTIITIPVK